MANVLVQLGWVWSVVATAIRLHVGGCMFAASIGFHLSRCLASGPLGASLCCASSRIRDHIFEQLTGSLAHQTGIPMQTRQDGVSGEKRCTNGLCLLFPARRRHQRQIDRSNKPGEEDTR